MTICATLILNPNSSSQVKRSSPASDEPTIDPLVHMKSLNQAQLSSVVARLLNSHPELYSEVLILPKIAQFCNSYFVDLFLSLASPFCNAVDKSQVSAMLPPPDLAPMEERLLYLKRNISRSLPNTRLESKTDSLAYNRVSGHLVRLRIQQFDIIVLKMLARCQIDTSTMY